MSMQHSKKIQLVVSGSDRVQCLYSEQDIIVSSGKIVGRLQKDTLIRSPSARKWRIINSSSADRLL